MRKEFGRIIKKNWYKFFLEFIALCLMIFFLSRPAKYLGKIIDLFGDIDLNQDAIIRNVIYILLAALGIAFFRLLYKVLEVEIMKSIRKDLKDSLYRKMLRLKLEDIKEIKNGQLMSYFVKDTKKVSRLFMRFFSTIIRSVGYISIAVYLMSKCSNLGLAFSVLIPVFLTIILIIFIRKRIKHNLVLSREAFTDLSEFVQENTDGIRTIKAFSGEESEIANFDIRSANLMNVNLKVTYAQNLADIMLNVGRGISYGITLLFGSRLVLESKMTVGDLISFMGYLSLLDVPMKQIPFMTFKISDFKISYSRLNDMFKMDEEVALEIDAEMRKIVLGDIKIKDLDFNYPDSDELVLKDINIDLKKGESLGIIGSVGSGKTTLMNLLLRLYGVSNGKISFGKRDINDIPIEILRSKICYITQDNFLFSTTIKENINLFKDDYDDEKILESIEKSMIYDEVNQMDDGIYTIIGEKGIDLSGGQKQRVVISRSFLKDSDIVIFDDTFSALDNRTEQYVLKNIKKLTKDKTCIIISNRISDIKDCDKIIVLDQGEIVERGTHNTLIDLNKRYYEFYKGQANRPDILN